MRVSTVFPTVFRPFFEIFETDLGRTLDVNCSESGLTKYDVSDEDLHEMFSMVRFSTDFRLIFDYCSSNVRLIFD